MRAKRVGKGGRVLFVPEGPQRGYHVFEESPTHLGGAVTPSGARVEVYVTGTHARLGVFASPEATKATVSFLLAPEPARHLARLLGVAANSADGERRTRERDA